MKFRTEIEPLPLAGMLSHRDRFLMLGSCFSDNIGRKLTERMFGVLTNPFGTLYNPASIADTVRRIATATPFTEADIHQSPSGQWFCYGCHTRLNAPEPSLLLDNLNRQLEAACEYLKQVTTACITSGTAWVFTLKSTGCVVANCQKQPSALFDRSRMSVDKCTNLLLETVRLLKSINSDMRILLTVSPIRHLADGAHGNQLSKSTLLLSCARAAETSNDITYFPAYEIMMDDLRDYRFYASDLKHPSDMAVDYIYDIFEKSFFSNDTIELSRRALALTRRLEHRPISQSPEGIKRFDEQTLSLINSLAQNYPEIYGNDLLNIIHSRHS